MHIKMDKVFQKDLTTTHPNMELQPKGPEDPGLRPITHKEFNEFIRGRGFKGRNNYK